MQPFDCSRADCIGGLQGMDFSLEKLVPEIMEHAVDLAVPLKVDSNSGDSWYDAK
jgi:hypothetical protein